MSESASQIAREAKGLQQGLKEVLKTKDPWDKEVEFQRKSLRGQYLRLILLHPYAKEAKDVETHLWMQISYQLIAIYKQRAAALDKALQSTPRHQPRPGGPGPVEYRKLMQRFRQFLAEEEKFWTQLIVRYHRSFALHEAQPALASLGITAQRSEATSPDAPDSQEREGELRQNNGRNHFQFPAEHNVMPNPLDSDDRGARLAVLSKALVCLGDIARYRELYNESGGRSKVGHDESEVSAKRGGRGRRGGPPGFESVTRARTYERAQLCYEQARLLVPHEGNPSHQLAILASYQKDVFGSLFHYYRALCVRQPYDTASENMGTILNKALEQWKARYQTLRQVPRDEESEAGALAPRVRIDRFKERVVVLHAIWRPGFDRLDYVLPTHAETVLQEFTSLVSDRILPTDTIVKVIVLSEGALWKHRMVRDTSSNGHKKSIPHDQQVLTSSIESKILSHVLALYRTLLDRGVVELAEPPPEDAAKNDLAQRITATFRRTLPALRIASKWLSANFKYVIAADSTGTAGWKTNQQNEARGALSPTGPPVGAEGIAQFWTSYANFFTVLLRTFPVERLPTMGPPLEEDMDMRGFLPLKKLMMGERSLSDSGNSRAETDGNTPLQSREKVHPNEEQLMRISDLLEDAKVVVESENSPIELQGGMFTFKFAKMNTPHTIPHAPQRRRRKPGEDHAGSYSASTAATSSVLDLHPDDEDVTTEEASRTDDDPVQEAFNKVLNSSDRDVEELDDEDDEEIVYPRATISPAGLAVSRLLPTSPTIASPISPMMNELTRSPRNGIPRSQIHSTPTSPLRQGVPASGPTAQDLLNNVMGNRSPLPSHPSFSSAPQPTWSFDPGHSIWSTSLDDNPLNFGATSSNIPSGFSHTQSGPQGMAQVAQLPPPWSSQYEANSNQQMHSPGMMPASGFPETFVNRSPGHHRVLSNNVTSLQHSPNQGFNFGPFESFSPQPADRRQHLQQPSQGLSYMGPAVVAATRSPNQGSFPDYSNHVQYVGVDRTYAPPLSQVWANHG